LPKGCKPTWFTTLETIILNNSSTRAISSQFLPLSNNSLAYSTSYFSTRAKPWLITYSLPSSEIVIGKAQ